MGPNPIRKLEINILISYPVLTPSSIQMWHHLSKRVLGKLGEDESSLFRLKGKVSMNETTC